MRTPHGTALNASRTFAKFGCTRQSTTRESLVDGVISIFSTHEAAGALACNFSAKDEWVHLFALVLAPMARHETNVRRVFEP